MPEGIHVESATLDRRQRRAKAGDEHQLAPRFISIAAAARHLGISRSFFYAHLVTRVRIIHIGARSLVEVSSLDRLADELAQG
jgi:hypothetical protein